MTGEPTGTDALRRGVQALREGGVPDAAADARHLLALALGVDRGRLTLRLADAMTPAQSEAYDALLARRIRREPVAQIVGERLFWGRSFRVTRHTLDPRPETEALVACALERPFRRVLDLGTGTGCLLVTLLAECPEAAGLGLDLSPEALAVAAANAARHGVADRAAFRVSDWYGGVDGRFDLILSNPPYISAAGMASLAPEVRDWEPRMALTDEGDGLAAYRAILGGAMRYVAPGGRVAVEVGAGQSEAVLRIGADAGLSVEGTRDDLDGRARVCVFRAAGRAESP
jgi:release factor glutamine methyltransferase